MEIMAAIFALLALKERCTVTLYSDSQLLVDSIERVGHLNGRRKLGRRVESGS